VEQIIDLLDKRHFLCHYFSQLFSKFKKPAVKKTTKITAIIFISLLLILSSMPGVHAVSSQSTGSGNQAISFQAPEPGAKVSALLSLQVDAKMRCQQTPPTADELSMMSQTGMRTENLGMQRIFIHLAQEPTAQQIDELEAMGITPYPGRGVLAVHR